MTDFPRVRTETLGGSALSRAIQAGDARWAAPAPTTREGWTSRVHSVARTASPAWREMLADASAADGEAAKRIRGAQVAVTTGQQPGLFGGPIYTLAKALTALTLADELQRETGTSVVPVFWAATDDADFDEASKVHVAVVGGSRELKTTLRPPIGTPMSAAELGDVTAQVATFREAVGSAAWEELLRTTERAYAPGASVGRAYVDLLRAVLHPLGIAVLDASHASVRRAAAEVHGRAAASAADIDARLAARNAEVRTAGFEPQVLEMPGQSLVFLNEGTTKRRLSIDEATRARDGAGHGLSSTVLLRPVVERTLLPTVAYVGGPAEIAYFAQCTAVADALDVPRPVVVPRWSTTIIEPRVARALDRIGMSVEEIADRDAAANRLAMRALPSDVETTLGSLEASVRSHVDALRSSADAVIAGEALDGAERSLEFRLQRLRRRFLAAVKRRELDAMQHLLTAHGSLFTGGGRQERALSWAQLLVRYGAPLIDAMRAEAGRHSAALVDSTASAPAAAPPLEIIRV
jgi:bacillithiol biosynthesis cysteine-adding enzyme BshC